MSFFSSTHSFTSSEMSLQQEILRKIPGKGIWTAPSRDQYLPAYFKDVCDQYLLQPNAGELKPVKVCAVLAQCFVAKTTGDHICKTKPTWADGGQSVSQLVIKFAGMGISFYEISNLFTQCFLVSSLGYVRF